MTSAGFPYFTLLVRQWLHVASVYRGLLVIMHFVLCSSVVGRPAARSASGLVWTRRTVLVRQWIHVISSLRRLCSNFLFYVVTRILRSVLVLLSACSVFAAKSTGELGFSMPRSCRQRQLYALGWFCWCRRTSRYVPFQWYMLCVSIWQVLQRCASAQRCCRCSSCGNGRPCDHAETLVCDSSSW